MKEQSVDDMHTATRQVKTIRKELLYRNCGQLEDEDEGHYRIYILACCNVCEQYCTARFRYQQVRQLTGEVVRWDCLVSGSRRMEFKKK
jgi:hypothetical protein